MALIKTSALISDIRGKLNGSVFQNSLGGLMLRTKSGSINRKTTSQFQSRTAVASVQWVWNNFTANDLAIWNTYATYRAVPQKNNPSLQINGQQIFIALNTLRWKMQTYVTAMSPVIIVSPILVMPYAPIDIVTIQNIAGGLYVTPNYSILAANQFFIFKLSAPLTITKQSQYNKLKLIPYTPNNGDLQDLTAGYISLFGGSPLIGQFINYEISVADVDTSTSSYVTRGRLAVI